jgi:hypothetical protein
MTVESDGEGAEQVVEPAVDQAHLSDEDVAIVENVDSDASTLPPSLKRKKRPQKSSKKSKYG